MVTTLIQSNDCLFQVNIDGDYVDMLCFKSFTVNITTDEKEITTVRDGQYKSFDYKILSYTVSLNGGMKIPDAVNPTLFDLMVHQQNFIEVPFRAIYKDSANALRYFSGVGIIKTTNIVTNASQIADGTIDMLGTGPYEIGDVLETLVDLTLIMEGDDSAIALAKFKLIDANGEVAFQTDVLSQAVSGNLVNPFNFTVQIPSGVYSIYYQVQSNVVGNTFETDAPPTLLQGFGPGTANYSSFGVQTYDFTAPRTVTFSLGVNNPPPTCVAPGHVGLNNKLGTEGSLYTGTITLTGSAPFNLTSVVKPAWMTISQTGNFVNLTGMPTAGLNQDISFNYSNACGSASFADQVDISANPDGIIIDWDFTKGTGVLFTAFTIWVNAVIQAFTTVTASNSFFANPGDTVQVRVTGTNGAIKHIDVQDTISGEIYDDNETVPVHDFIFVTTIGHDYQINASIVNP